MTPMLALNELYLAGLSCTDLAFMRTHNRLGALRTCLPQVQRLVRAHPMVDTRTS